jgi:lipoprotein-anchoring transpeptidase ErfK/SrfK
MQNRSLLLCLSLALSCLASTAQAVTRTDYDPVTKKWISYDTKADSYFHGGAAAIPRELVNYDGPYGPNTIVINTDERRLYYVFEKGKAIKYGIGVGREGFEWSGTDTISRKAEWPGWTPPPEMIVREKKTNGRIIPNYMAGGLDNPLGARALYIGERIYRIHGSNEPWSIGHAVSSGCIRLVNQDIIDLYDRVTVGTRVVVLLSTQPQTEDAVASTGGEDKRLLPKPGFKAPLPAAPVFAVKASAKAIDKAAGKPVVLAKVPAQPAVDASAAAEASPPPAAPSTPVVEAKAAVEPAPEAKPVAPPIEVKASVSAAMSGAPVAAAEARAAIEVKKPVVVMAPDKPSRKDEPVDGAPPAPAPAAAAPAEDVSGQGRS